MLCNLPPELIIRIGENLQHFCNLNALVQSNRYFYRVLNDLLYGNALKDPSITTLGWVAQTGREGTIRKFLAAGLEIDVRCHNSWHPIVLAAESGHVGVVGTLLEHVIVNRVTEPWHDRDQERLLGEILIAAARHGRELIVKFLMEYGVNLDPDAGIIGEAIYQATCGRHVGIMKLLLETSCGQRYVHDSRITTIVRYAAARELPLLLVLIHAGMEISTFSSITWLGTVAFDSAQRSGNLAVVQFFLETECIPTSYLLDSFQHITLRYPRLALLYFTHMDIEKLMSHGDYMDQHHLLMGALLVGLKRLAERLLQILYPIECFPIAATSAVDFIKAAVYSQKIEMVELVLRGRSWTGIRIFIFPDLHYAIAQHLNEIARLLLDVIGHPQSEWAKLVQTALSCGNLQIAQYLLGRYPMSYLAASAPWVLQAAVLGGEASFDTLLRWGWSLQSEDPQQRRALESAVIRADIPVIRAFMKAGFDPNHCSPRSKRPLLSIAAMSDEPPSVEAVNLLLAFGANMDLGFSHLLSSKPSIEGLQDSPRRITTMLDGRRLRGVKILLEEGANPLALDKHGEYILVLAAFEGYLPIVKLFLRSFDKHVLPFHRTKDVVWRAASTNHRETAQCLSNYYWRHMYPT
ncbi:hypothetical protein N7494_005472 [Penicillium frequentans]|uniref:Uncharacterized protein n=1 Tax=Penicillium frequentans TaxID=3151616 RepID=A0AAD6CY76_9EURO|nr:hypothetical protein N7494_005472 [Penicillium glabrum]